MNKILALGNYKFDISRRTLVMGILNRTPDSFSDGGKFLDDKIALLHINNMIKSGADIIDIGGESTRPGAEEVGVSEEIKRVIPLIKKISRNIKVPLSIDTRHSEVAEAALKNGASIVNDITALFGDKRMREVVSRYKASVILVHMRGTPLSMQKNIKYKSLIADMIEELRKSINLAKEAGIEGDKIIVDPGIGFGKTPENNIEILRRLNEFSVLKKPILIGTSRKSFIGKIIGKNESERLSGTIATVVIGITNGASIVRVHDVLEVKDAVTITDRILKA